MYFALSSDSSCWFSSHRPVGSTSNLREANAAHIQYAGIRTFKGKTLQEWFRPMFVCSTAPTPAMHDLAPTR